MSTSTHFLQRLRLASLACSTLLMGCNDLLQIDPPAKQLLQTDAGTVVLRDSGTGNVDAARAGLPDATADMTAQTASPAPPRSNVTTSHDAGAEQTPDAGSAQSPYVWANWPMPNPQSTGLPNQQGYATLAAGRVADKVTHLEWQQWSDDKARTWSDAVAYCSGMMLGDGGSWRLPSRIELLSLLDFTTATPAMDAQAFSGAPAEAFWSSSPFIGAQSSAWGVNFGFRDGFMFTDNMSQPHRVRCVR
jgi:hypothetical protein